jgi:hypothetical protein
LNVPFKKQSTLPLFYIVGCTLCLVFPSPFHQELPASRKTSANAFGLLDDMPDIKTMRRRKRESQGSAQASPAHAPRSPAPEAAAGAAPQAEPEPAKQSGRKCG